MESLVGCVPDGLLLVKEDWTILWCSPRFAEMVQTTEPPRGSLSSWIQGFEEFRDAVVYGLDRDKRAAVPALLQTADESRKFVVIHASPCHADVPARWALAVQDRSEIEALQRRLDDRERSHSFLRSGTSDLIIRIDANWQIIWCNEAASDLFIEGPHLQSVLSASSFESLQKGFHGSTDGEDRFAVQLESPENARPVFSLNGTARILRDDNGEFNGLSMILADDSEAHRLGLFAAKYELSPREQEVVQYLVQGYSNLNIAAILGLSESGVKFHIRNVFSRAKVASRTELMARMLVD